MKTILTTLAILLACSAYAQTDSVTFNDGRIIPCQIVASNFNYLKVRVDSADYIVEKKYVNRYTLYSKSQPSLVVKNMDYEHSVNTNYRGLGHNLETLNYKTPLASAGNSLIASGFLMIAGTALSLGGLAAKSTPLTYIGAGVSGVSIIPLIVSGIQLVKAANRNKRFKFIH